MLDSGNDIDKPSSREDVSEVVEKDEFGEGNVAEALADRKIDTDVLPVLRDVANAIGDSKTVGGALDAAMVNGGIEKLNSNGDRVYMRVTGEAVLKLQVGPKGQYGGDISITQIGDGPEAKFNVRTEKHTLAALTGQLSIPQVPVKGEAGVQTYDAVEMTFPTKDEAAQAASTLQRLAIADMAGDVGDTISQGKNPAANPMTESGAPNEAAQAVLGLTDEDRTFLQAHITAYEQTVTARGRLAVEAKVPQIFAPVQPEMGVELRADGRGLLTRRTELPTETEKGSLTYTVARDVRISAKEKLTLDPLPSSQLVAGVAFQNRAELAEARLRLSATFDIPANTTITTSDYGGREVPEIDVFKTTDDLLPDRLSAELNYEYRDQSLLDLSRRDSQTQSLRLDINQPGKAPEAFDKFLRGDMKGAVAEVSVELTREMRIIEKSGVNTQQGVILEILEGNKFEATVITIFGNDDVVQSKTLKGMDAITGGNTDGGDIKVEPKETPVSAPDTELPQKPSDEIVPTGRTNNELEEQDLKRIVVQKDDNIWDLAQKHGVDFNKMKALNSQHIQDADMIFPGDALYLPGSARKTTPNPEKEPAVQAPITPSGIPEAMQQAISQGTTSAAAATTSAAATLSDFTQEILSPSDRGQPIQTPPLEAGSIPAQQIDGRPDLSNILATRQVPETETVNWSPKLPTDTLAATAGWIGKQLKDADILNDLGSRMDKFAKTAGNIHMTKAEIAQLDKLNVVDQARWASITDSTREMAAEAYKKPTDSTLGTTQWLNDGHLDAYRHSLWNGRMTQAFGVEWTAAYATGHETVKGNPAAREAMDLWNNEVGRRIAQENPDASTRELADLVMEAINKGEMVVIDTDGNLAWSDQIPVGQHGMARNKVLQGNQDYAAQMQQDDPSRSGR